MNSREFEAYEISLTGQYNFSITFCPICHGAKSIFNFKTEKSESNAELAFTLAKLSFEHRGTPICKHACACQQKALDFKNLLDKENVKISKDSGWKKTSSLKSMVEYSRRIDLRTKPTKEQINIIVEWMKYDRSPGLDNVWLDLKNSEDTKLIFKTIWDFSD